MDVTGKRKVWFILSALVIIACAAVMFINGFILDTDFAGGVSLQYNLHKELDSEEIREIEKLVYSVKGFNGASVQKAGSTGVVIKAPASDDLNPDAVAEVRSLLNDRYKQYAPVKEEAPEEEKAETNEETTTEKVESSTPNEITPPETETTETETTETTETETADTAEVAPAEITDETVAAADGKEATTTEAATTEAATTEAATTEAATTEAATTETADTETTESAETEEKAEEETAETEEEADETTAIDDLAIEVITETTISASVSKEIRTSAVTATIIAVLCMLAYIIIRFEWRAAIAAVLCLIHDIFIVVASYSIFNIPVSSGLIAVVLTILGYSINATIILFDRVRENRRKLGRTDFGMIVNISARQTLMRSINTTLTTLFTIGLIYILGVPSIQNFALPIIVGVVVGLYSSIFLSGSFWYVLSGKRK